MASSITWKLMMEKNITHADGAIIHAYQKAISNNIGQHIMKTYASINPSTLKDHLLTHTREKIYNCQQCTYSCSKAEHLRRHMMIHTGEMSYSCEQCTYSCSRADSLKRHMLTHTGEKNYRCVQCTYSCSLAGNLRSHIMTHTGDKKYYVIIVLIPALQPLVLGLT